MKYIYDITLSIFIATPFAALQLYVLTKLVNCCYVFGIIPLLILGIPYYFIFLPYILPKILLKFRKLSLLCVCLVPILAGLSPFIAIKGPGLIYSLQHPINEPIEFTNSGVKYKMIRGYFSTAGTPRNSGFFIRASKKENMTPWIFSESYKNDDESDMIQIKLNSLYSKERYKNFVEHKIEDMRDRARRLFPEESHKFDYGLYHNKFYRYNQLSGKYVNSVQQIYISNVFLVPIQETKTPMLIECNGTMRERDFCTIRTFTEDRVSYEYRIRVSEIENFSETDKSVKQFVDSLSVAIEK